MPIGAILAISGISALIGGIVGMVTGEGLLRGAVGGLNWIGNAGAAIGDLFTGRLARAGMHIIGVSDDKIAAIESGTETFYGNYRDDSEGLSAEQAFGIFMGQSLGIGTRDWYNPEAASAELGLDIIGGVSTLALGQWGSAAWFSKHASNLTQSGLSGAMMFQVGKTTQNMQNTFSDISDSLRNQINSFIGGNILGATGSPDRFNWDDDSYGEGLAELGSFFTEGGSLDDLPDHLQEYITDFYDIDIEDLQEILDQGDDTDG